MLCGVSAAVQMQTYGFMLLADWLAMLTTTVKAAFLSLVELLLLVLQQELTGES